MKLKQRISGGVYGIIVLAGAFAAMAGILALIAGDGVSGLILLGSSVALISFAEAM